MGRVVIRLGGRQGVEPVVEASIELGDQRLGGTFLRASESVERGDQDERDDDPDDDHHDQELEHGETEPSRRSAYRLSSHGVRPFLDIDLLPDRDLNPTDTRGRNRVWLENGQFKRPLWKLVKLSLSTLAARGRCCC